MKNGTIFITGLIMLILSAWKSNDTQKTYQLYYDIPVGKKFDITFTRSDNYDFEYMGNLSVINSTDKLVYGFEVDENNKDAIEFKITFKDASYVTDNRNVTAPADLSELIGERVGARLKKTGKIISVTDFDDLPVIEVPGKGQLNEEKYSIAFHMLFNFLPDRQLRIGDKWKDNQTFTENGPSSIFNIFLDKEFTLKEEKQMGDKYYLVIYCQNSIRVEGEGKMNGMPFTALLTGTGSDTLIYDQMKNMITSTNGTLEINGSAEINDDGLKFSMPMHHLFKESIIVNMK